MYGIVQDGNKVDLSEMSEIFLVLKYTDYCIEWLEGWAEIEGGNISFCHSVSGLKEKI